MNTKPASRFDYVKYDEKSAEVQARLKAAAQDVEDAIEKLDAAIHNMDQLICEQLANDAGFLPPNGELARQRLDDVIGDGRSADDMLCSLEETYMWCGKTIRDQQIERNGSAELQEERTNA